MARVVFTSVLAATLAACAGDGVVANPVAIVGADGSDESGELFPFVVHVASGATVLGP
jgi:hypothetical protein